MNRLSFSVRARRGLLLTILILAAPVLAGCAKATPTLIPTLAVTPPAGTSAAAGRAAGGAVTASAEVVPARYVEVGFAAAGVIQTIHVQEGDRVKADDPLAVLTNQAELQAAVDAAEQALRSAQQALAAYQANAPLALANARLAVVQNQKRYNDAVKYHKRPNMRRCSEDTLELYTKRYEDAKERLQEAKDNNDGSLGALERIQEAQNVYNTAYANYIYCMGYTEQEILESDAELAAAEAALKQSEEYYARLQAEGGLDPNEVARLNAAIAAAQANLTSAQAALARAVLLAPFEGEVVQVIGVPGQAVVPGQPVVALADLSTLQIETTDLSERDVARVKVGQTARVTVDALGADLPGKVTKIAPRASKIGGDVVFKVTIALDEPPEGLRWGMSAKVEIQP